MPTSSGRRVEPAEAADPEPWLATLLEEMPSLAFRARQGGEWTWSNPQWSAFTGLTAAQSAGHGWLEAVHPEDRAGWLAALGGARPEAFSVEHRLCRASDRSWRWFETQVHPASARGVGVEWLGLARDVDEARRLKQMEATLTGIRHDVRNTLGVITAILRRTAERSHSAEDLAMHLEGRIGAIARVQSALLRNPGAGLDVGLLLADELAAYAVHEGGQAELNGAPVRLPPRSAGSFALMAQELATNAVKFGAFSAPGGQVVARWSVSAREGEDWLDFVWEESGAPPRPDGELHRGFGTELLERTLPYELRARTERIFGREGVRVRVAFPLAAPSPP